MTFWAPDSLRAACAGSWIVRPAAGARHVEGLCTDTRIIREGEAFLALRGERFDGHDFLTDAARARASLLIIDDPPEEFAPPPGVAVLKVPDTARALLRLAGAYRRTLEGTRVVAVTGSNGKTTTTRLIHGLLSRRLRGVTSPKSFNNAVGVPLTILKARPGDQFLVCEVGINAPGEMADLASTIRPDVAVITSIGRAHLEGFGSVEAVCREKAALLSFLEPDGCAIVTADAPGLSDFLRPAPNLVTFGRSAHADLRLTSVEHVEGMGGGPAIRFTINDRTSFVAPLIGEHNALNAAAAIAVARRFGLENEEIAEGLLSASPADMRLSLRRRGDIWVLNDAYNANPDSAIAAIRAFAALSHGAERRVVVLGDMLELGDHAPEAHREVADAIHEAGVIDAVIAVGPLALHAAERLERLWPAGRIHIVPALTEKAIARAIGVIRAGDWVLLKASRGVGLERVEEALAKRAGSPARARA